MRFFGRSRYGRNTSLGSSTFPREVPCSTYTSTKQTLCYVDRAIDNALLFGMLAVFAFIVWKFAQGTYRWITKTTPKNPWKHTTAHITDPTSMEYTVDGVVYPVKDLDPSVTRGKTTLDIVYKAHQPKDWDFAEDRPEATSNKDPHATIRFAWIMLFAIGASIAGAFVYAGYFSS
ncbi:hypothetical protein KBD13_01985 [Patescibacteria group bacterium]|nr:hypothetical protein [Patescibacteria group bacterium]MDQ5919478.1 hypothetical protein [Patescibacteria group bacterium]